jgi:hypothetical protein
MNSAGRVVAGRIAQTWVSIPKRVRWGTSSRRSVDPFRTSSVVASGSIRAAAPPLAMPVRVAVALVLECSGGRSCRNPTSLLL